MAAEVMTQPPAVGSGQMSEALQRFLRESDEAERASRASEDLHSADDVSSEHAASTSEAKDFTLDLKNLDISSRNISLQGMRMWAKMSSALARPCSASYCLKLQACIATKARPSASAPVHPCCKAASLLCQLSGHSRVADLTIKVLPGLLQAACSP